MSESNNDSSDQTNVEARAKSNKLIKTKVSIWKLSLQILLKQPIPI